MWGEMPLRAVSGPTYLSCRSDGAGLMGSKNVSVTLASHWQRIPSSGNMQAKIVKTILIKGKPVEPRLKWGLLVIGQPEVSLTGYLVTSTELLLLIGQG
ncbi:Uncharacterised protein [Dermatophilus congolensis]|uniref:Uncharacterized protein n=1 Tax=Dermatophilus congolensis TaxID=1863 RepID=A0AA46BPZ4_9MICO|nr:Uncharacterised protein [Dermatophilus congolensis]